MKSVSYAKLWRAKTKGGANQRARRTALVPRHKWAEGHHRFGKGSTKPRSIHARVTLIYFSAHDRALDREPVAQRRSLLRLRRRLRCRLHAPLNRSTNGLLETTSRSCNRVCTHNFSLIIIRFETVRLLERKEDRSSIDCFNVEGIEYHRILGMIWFFGEKEKRKIRLGKYEARIIGGGSSGTSSKFYITLCATMMARFLFQWRNDYFKIRWNFDWTHDAF